MEISAFHVFGLFIASESAFDLPTDRFCQFHYTFSSSINPSIIHLFLRKSRDYFDTPKICDGLPGRSAMNIASYDEIITASKIAGNRNLLHLSSVTHKTPPLPATSTIPNHSRKTKSH